MKLTNYLAAAALIGAVGCGIFKNAKPKPKFHLIPYKINGEVGVILDCGDWKSFYEIRFIDAEYDGTLNRIEYYYDNTSWKNRTIVQEGDPGFQGFKYLYEDAKHDLLESQEECDCEK